MVSSSAKASSKRGAAAAGLFVLSLLMMLRLPAKSFALLVTKSPCHPVARSSSTFQPLHAGDELAVGQPHPHLSAWLHVLNRPQPLARRRVFRQAVAARQRLQRRERVEPTRQLPQRPFAPFEPSHER